MSVWVNDVTKYNNNVNPLFLIAVEENKSKQMQLFVFSCAIFEGKKADQYNELSHIKYAI